MTPYVIFIIAIMLTLLVLLMVEDRREKKYIPGAVGFATTPIVVKCGGDFAYLKDLDPNRIQSRQIMTWRKRVGINKIKDSGLLGLKLKGNDKYEAEWLILTILKATEWLILDDRWVDCDPKYHDKQKPMISLNTDKKWDELTEIIVGATILDIETEPKQLRVTLNNNEKIYKLEIPDTKNLPPFSAGSPRRWHPEDDLNNAFLVSPTDQIEIL